MIFLASAMVSVSVELVALRQELCIERALASSVRARRAPLLYFLLVGLR